MTQSNVAPEQTHIAQQATVKAANHVADRLVSTIKQTKKFFGLKSPNLFLNFADAINPEPSISVRPTPDVVVVLVNSKVAGAQDFTMRFFDSNENPMGNNLLNYPADFDENGQLEKSGAQKIAGLVVSEIFSSTNPARKNTKLFGFAEEIVAMSLDDPSKSFAEISETVRISERELGL